MSTKRQETITYITLHVCTRYNILLTPQKESTKNSKNIKNRLKGRSDRLSRSLPNKVWMGVRYSFSHILRSGLFVMALLVVGTYYYYQEMK